MDITMLIVAMGIPSAITCFCFWMLEQKISKREAKAEEQEKKRVQEAEDREAARRENETLVIEGVIASIALGEATARAVGRIPDAHCNGDMHAALAYATAVKNKHRDFMRKQGVDALY